MNSSEYQLYQDIRDKHEDLQQGDIIDGTTNKKICDLIKTSYPFLPHQKYIAYLVITQTCDLVRRGENENQCKEVCGLPMGYYRNYRNYVISYNSTQSPECEEGCLAGRCQEKSESIW